MNPRRTRSFAPRTRRPATALPIQAAAAVRPDCRRVTPVMVFSSCVMLLRERVLEPVLHPGERHVELAGPGRCDLVPSGEAVEQAEERRGHRVELSRARTLDLVGGH